MRAINCLLWHVALILLLVICNLPSLAWFAGGMSFMFWIVVWALAQKEVRGG